MEAFKYVAQSSSGQKVTGVVEAFNEMDAVSKIKNTYSVVLQMSEVKEKGKLAVIPPGREETQHPEMVGLGHDLSGQVDFLGIFPEAHPDLVQIPLLLIDFLGRQHGQQYRKPADHGDGDGVFRLP